MIRPVQSWHKLIRLSSHGIPDAIQQLLHGHFESPLVSNPCGLCTGDVRDGEEKEGMSLGDENPG